jgi:hypothetical protein
MKRLLSICAALALSTSAFAMSHKGAPDMAASGAMAASAPMAGAGGCAGAADQKKLAGAARTSFIKKCESDAGAACEAKATEKKLAGAAKTSFTKKCVTDAQAAVK